MFDVDGYREWLKTRPESVQNLAEEFPFYYPVLIHGEEKWICSYTESGCLTVSDTPLWEDYERAIETRKLVHVDCLRKACGCSKSTDLEAK